MKFPYKGISTASILYRWIISYIVILFITLIVSSLIFTESTKIIENYVNDAIFDSLKQYRLYIDERLKDMDRMSIELGIDTNVKSVLTSLPDLLPIQRYSMLDIMQSLKTYKISNSFIRSASIFFPNPNEENILSDAGLYDARDWYNLNYSSYGLTYEQFRELITASAKKEYRVITKPSDSARRPDYKIFIVHPLLLDYSNKLVASFFMTIDDKAIIEAMSQPSNDTYPILYAVDKNNNILFSNSGEVQAYSIDYSLLANNEGKKITKTESGDMIISYISSSITDWKYVSVTPAQVFGKKLQYIKRVTVIGIILSLVLGLWIAYLFASRNYKSLSKILNLFGNNLKESTDNEYAYLEKSIQTIIDENKKIYTVLDQQKESLKASFISRLIKGQIDNMITLDNLCRHYNVSFKGDCFQTILFYIEDFSDTFLKAGYDSSNSDAILETTIAYIKDNVKKASVNHLNSFIIQIDGIIACLLDYEKESHLNDVSVAFKAVQAIRENVKNELGIFLSISISSIHSSYGELKTSYQEALEVLEYQRLIGSNEVMSHNDINKQKGLNDTLFNVYFDKYKNLLITKDFNGAKSLLDEMLDTQIFMGASSLQLIKCKIFSFIDMMLNTMKDIRKSYEGSILEELHAADKLLRCQSISELKKESGYILDKIANVISEYESANSINLTKKIRDYVNNNYTNKNLSVSMIAENMGISSSYLTRHFKKETGLSVLEYIQQTRITKAKELMQQQANVNISLIADQTGFYNSIGLIRIFKKIEGVPPGKYRQSQQELQSK